MVVRDSRMSVSGQEALRCPGVFRRPFRKSGSGREALPVVWVWSGGLLGWRGVVGRPSRISGNGQEALQDVWKWSAGPPDVWEALLDVCEGSGGPQGCPVVIGRSSRNSGSDRWAFPYVR